MAVIPIYNCFHPVMREKAQPVTKIDGKLKKFVDDLHDTLYNIPNGVGLAANQVGSNHSIFMLDMSIRETGGYPKPLTLINPYIEYFSDDDDEDLEGCLSIPEFFEKVKRPQAVQVKYYDIKGKEHSREFDGFIARVIQHEYDHLDGILFTDHLTPLRKALSKSKLKKIEKGGIETDYPMIHADGSKVGNWEMLNQELKNP